MMRLLGRVSGLEISRYNLTTKVTKLEGVGSFCQVAGRSEVCWSDGVILLCSLVWKKDNGGGEDG